MEGSWVAEVLVQFSRSPVWRTPVDNFVDDHCYMFDNETEMKLEYTVAHKEFMELIDKLLTNFVRELGITVEEAMEELMKALASKETEIGGEVNNFVTYIFSADDFESFHRMMRRRNIELDILAMSALQEQGINISGLEQEDDITVRRLQELRIAAIRENAGYAEDEALRIAIEESLKEQGAASKILELEDAELQEALALSIRMEEEKARVQRREVAREVELVARTDPTAAARIQAEKTAVIEQIKSENVKALESKTLLMREEKVREIVGTMDGLEIPPPQKGLVVNMEGGPDASVPPSRMATMKAAESYVPQKGLEVNMEGGPDASVPPSRMATMKAAESYVPQKGLEVNMEGGPDASVPPSRMATMSVPSFDIKRKSALELLSAPVETANVISSLLSTPASEPPPPPASQGSKKSTAPLPVAPPAKAPPAFSDKLGFRPLPSLPSLSQVPLAALKAKVQAETTPAVSTGPGAARGQPTKEELEERARYMRAQREKILQMNKTSRQQELQNYATANSIPVNVETHTTLDAEKQLTVEIARRLRGDILGEIQK